MNKKALTLFFLLILAAMLLISCSSSSDDQQNDGDEESSDGDREDEDEMAEAIDCSNCEDFTGVYCFYQKDSSNCPTELQAFIDSDFSYYAYTVRKKEETDCHFIISIPPNLLAGYPSGDLAEVAGCDYEFIQFYAGEGAIDPAPPIPSNYNSSNGVMLLGLDTCNLTFTKAACSIVVDGDEDLEQSELDEEIAPEIEPDEELEAELEAETELENEAETEIEAELETELEDEAQLEQELEAESDIEE